MTTTDADGEAPVTMARVTAAEVLRQMRALAGDLGTLGERLAGTVANLGDPTAVEIEIDSIRAAAEQRAATAEAARAEAERRAANADRTRTEADEAAQEMSEQLAAEQVRARDAHERLAQAVAAHAAEVDRIRADAQERIEHAAAERDAAITEATAARQAAEERAERAAADTREVTSQAREEVAAAEARTEDAHAETAYVRQDAARELDELRASAQRERDEITARLADAVARERDIQQRLTEATAARQAAEERAERAAAEAREAITQARADAAREREELREVLDSRARTLEESRAELRARAERAEREFDWARSELDLRQNAAGGTPRRGRRAELPTRMPMSPQEPATEAARPLLFLLEVLRADEGCRGGCVRCGRWCAGTGAETRSGTARSATSALALPKHAYRPILDDRLLAFQAVFAGKRLHRQRRNGPPCPTRRHHQTHPRHAPSAMGRGLQRPDHSTRRGGGGSSWSLPSLVCPSGR